MFNRYKIEIKRLKQNHMTFYDMSHRVLLYYVSERQRMYVIIVGTYYMYIFDF